MSEHPLKSYHIVGTLGIGCYGEVLLVQHTDTNKLYALKVIPKTNRENFQKRVIGEKQYLQLAEPFGHSPTLHNCYQTSAYVFFLMEYIPGPTLDKAKATVDPIIIFAQLVVIIQKFHKNNIYHRDLKPANIIIYNGYPVIIDFGLSVYKPDVANDGSNLCNSIVGSPLYRSPEINLHDDPYKPEMADVWSLGVILFELLFGERPFDAPNYEKFVELIIQYSTNHKGLEWRNRDNVTDEQMNLIKGLLHPNPTKRTTLEAIREHPALKTINWEKLEKGLNTTRPPPIDKPLQETFLMEYYLGKKGDGETIIGL